MVAQVRRLPGVEEVVASDHGILDGMMYEHSGLQLEGALPEQSAVTESVIARYISPDYFRMLGISLMRGREFAEPYQLAPQKLVMVNQTMARTYCDTLNI